MTLCWSLEPTDRPTFKLIGQLIDQLLQTSTDTSPHRGKQVKRGHVLSNVGLWLRWEIKLTRSFLNRSCTGTLLIARRRRSETHWRVETMARSDGRQVTAQNYLKIRDRLSDSCSWRLSEFSPFYILPERHDDQSNPVTKNIYQLSWSFRTISICETQIFNGTSRVKTNKDKYQQIAGLKNKLVHQKVKKVTKHFLCQNQLYWPNLCTPNKEIDSSCLCSRYFV